MPYYRCPSCGLTSYSAASYSTASVCPVCSTGLVAEGRLHLVPGTQPGFQRSLRARPEAASEARRAVSTLPVPEQNRQSLALVVSELVTNSILHAELGPESPIDLHVVHDGLQVRVAVHDSGAGFAPRTAASRPEGGLGMMVVAELAESWGVDCDADGCTTWCVLTVDRPAARAAAPLLSASPASG
jgi:anti-sigma regulatory factor (Ser/Thr protein kinase)